MAYRPYPNADRALKQLDRHYPLAPELRGLECLRPMEESFAKLRVAAKDWRPDFIMDETGRQAPFVGRYVLSSRRLGVVGGGE